ncbi:hypothetical protein BWQ96_08232 [Gracilariopsis chorda]|uniref:Uncharacterized protein n=1 Tax=Gracilariopsis chorda TaxID=448386 RepID=A0A2V3IIZ3_9FLOR|nr:hypothetical protein BWQ96_08232 [Gracilariopsis chorda]|eukprot:PXF42064.1 hypothetical protein BWQ96_08232 [Gracilariopsis chorda]
MNNWLVLFTVTAAVAWTCHGQKPICPDNCISGSRSSESATEVCSTPPFGLCTVIPCTLPNGNAGHSCSIPPGCVVVPESVVNGLEFFVNYSFPNGDLDTGTRFLDQAVGPGCGSPSDLLAFSGDSFFSGNQFETATAQIGLARQQGLWEDSTTIEMNADWFFTAFNPVTIMAEFRDSSTQTPVEGAIVTFVVDVSNDNNSCTNLLATAEVKIVGSQALLCINQAA